jgi:thiamine-monophosphate kinase
LEASQCGADIAIDNVAACAAFQKAEHSFSLDFCRQMTAAGGDDYELAFTAPTAQRDAVAAAAARAATPVQRVGSITAQRGLVLRDAAGAVVNKTFDSFDHFK